MKIQDIDKLYYEVSDLLMDLAIVSSKKGFHLDNDLEGGLFGLLLDNNYNEMLLVKSRVTTAIKKIKDGTFKLSNADKELIIHQKAKGRVMKIHLFFKKTL